MNKAAYLGSVLGLMIGLAFPAVASAFSASTTCSRSDTDSTKCMLCAIAWEANADSEKDMRRVAGVVLTRVASDKYPNSICKVVYQKGQFHGPYNNAGKKLSSKGLTNAHVAKMVGVANSARANGYLSFHACDGVNCLTRKVSLLDSAVPYYTERTQVAGLATENPSEAMDLVNSVMGDLAPVYQQSATLVDDTKAIN